jgi:hypothetical protein
MLDANPHLLANDVPYGEYRVDFVAMELLLGGAVLSTYGKDEFVRLVREGVSAAASGAMMFTRIILVWRPEKLRLTNRFLHDLRAIQVRIKRNEGLNKDELLVSRKPTSIRKGSPVDDATALQTALGVAAKTIEDYLESYLPDTMDGGNYDWFTSYFIDLCFDLWCRYVRVDLNNALQVFNKLLAAAWRDVQFPAREQDGQRLEDWLADRVRKHFSGGFYSSRRYRQELDLEFARLRAEMRPQPQ